ncbi:MAG TPA: alcohol dehydrogenase catalytic domain-containing protein [Pseudolabrys sp.]|nr:alcohol dehydrogenase catalytic domain-containing protein [Pseudolabrys sp.]
MKAVVIEAFGAPETLKVREFPTPQPGRKDILIEVQAAGVCHHDVLHRAGKLPGAKAGVVPGHETAGTIVGIGADVTTHALGDRVVVYQRRFCGECRNCLRGRQDLCRAMGAPAVDTEGGYAQFICVPSNMGIRIPDGVDWASAALASCPIGTSLRALKSVAGINPGDSVLINGASGGLGVHQIQIARALGGRPIAVTTSAAKVALLKSLGAEMVVVSPDAKFSAEVWKATGKRGVDIAIDNVGSTLPETLRCVTQGGIVVVLGNVGGEAVPVSPGLLIGRRIRVVGSGMAPLDEVHQSLAMLAAGLVKAVISETVTFPQAAKAHALLENRGVQGRVVMQGW